ncbi:UDP-N-acetylmuramate dehydrogenase [Robiginitalea marina]|uniref:UDP-N-acetylenolpyruvoylglucosamine reductase n=1 Tax=Robiginitalea marina TaxID=2954105 RepID=A0ABT1AZ51_9FLAO|nr:UDP-N-acetylmuramate dehydrogenase [Robiginitalea marina]MCO5724850.1 UDP-N-acetylmuramate dehydrogenase [Robiginitalea marina]
MELRKNVSLKPYNTFGIDVQASHFVEVRSVDTLREALALEGVPPPFILGGGSNLLLTGPLKALVLYINIPGKEIVREAGNEVVLRVMAGENWHELVMWSLRQGFGGLENLSLIPGKAGTAPIQNIGAYGVELKDVFQSCEALDMASGKLRRFDREACRFGYRDSFFKREGKGKYIIVSVDFRLTRKEHQLHTSYGDLQKELQAAGITNPGPPDVARAVIAIRQRKLPDPAQLGNSGSFFKNPVIPQTLYDDLKKQFPELPGYLQDGGEVKVPAGWLIERCGFKGFRQGDAGVHEHQALVLVNYGRASGQEILGLSLDIRKAVLREYSIALQPEVNVI